MRLSSKSQGFTLLELLICISIIGILTALSTPVYESFARRNDLDLTTETVVSMLRRAQTYATAVDENSSWGVELQATTITLFKGSSFGARDTLFDETLGVPGSVTMGGLGEVRFAVFTGLPSATGNVTLTSNTSDVRTITVNAKGLVDY